MGAICIFLDFLNVREVMKSTLNAYSLQTKRVDHGSLFRKNGSFIKTPQATYNPDHELNISYPGVMTITNGRAKIEYASFYNDYEGKITQSKIYDQIWYVDHKLAFGKNCRSIHHSLNGNEWK